MTTPVGRAEQLVKIAPDIVKITSGTSFAGKVTLSSGSATVDVVYPSLVATDLFTSLVAEVASISAISSRATFLGVTSKVVGTGFTVGWGNGVAYSCDIVVHWVVTKTA